jgi:hypothetical protein
MAIRLSDILELLLQEIPKKKIIINGKNYGFGMHDFPRCVNLLSRR